MIVIYYYNWKGTEAERDKYEKDAKEFWSKIKGVKLTGMYTPTIPWNRAWFFETDSVDLLLKNSGKVNPLIKNTDLVIFLP